jgi:hypothetical protein
MHFIMPPPFKRISTANAAAVIVGASAAILFAVSWFRYIAGNDGFVRFYEQLYGFSILSAWIIVSALGVWMARKCSNAKTSVRVLGTGLTVAAGLGMLLICIKTITHIRYMDFPAKSTETLLEIAGTPHAQARDSAILELGIRRVTDAVPLLCTIMEEQHAARADRSSAANALGRICKYPCQSRMNKERVLTVLIAALRNDTSDPHGDVVVYQAAWALGQIRDIRSVAPLGNVACNSQLPQYIREAAIRALGKIGGTAARRSLESARDKCANAQMRTLMDHILEQNEKVPNG